MRVVFSLPNDWSALYRGATRFQGDRTPEPIFTFDLYTFFQRRRFEFWGGQINIKFFNKMEHTHVCLAAHNLFLFLGQLAMLKDHRGFHFRLFSTSFWPWENQLAHAHTRQLVPPPSLLFIYSRGKHKSFVFTFKSSGYSKTHKTTQTLSGMI